MSGRANAMALWGRAAVDRALAHPAPAPTTSELLDDIDRRADEGAAAMAAWGRTLGAATFAAVVRLVAGEARRDLLRAAQAAGEGSTH